MAHLGNSFFVVGIDFGTTYSGYAFASRQDFASDPPKYITSSWQGCKLLPLKAPTAVLLNAKKELVSFGYEAENQFSELMSKEEHENYYYFHQFKTLLNYQRVTRKTEIQDVTKKSMPAITVFSLAIRFLKDHLLEKIQERLKSALTEDEFYFVLTVPAIWDDPAKQFMREAAETAGIRQDKISIVPEPIAAATFCQISRRKEPLSDFDRMKYMIIDIGGRTTDIAVYTRKLDGTIIEVLDPISLSVGGECAGDGFYSFLSEIFGEYVMHKLIEEENEDYIDLFREFETKKRSIRTDQTNNIVITLPVSLTDLYKKRFGDIEYVIEKSKHRGHVFYAKQKLHIFPETFRGLFACTVKQILDFVHRVFAIEQISDVRTICLVGGFSECKLMQDAIRGSLGTSKRLIIPEEAGIAVLKGAVLYGHSPVRIHVKRNLVAPEPSTKDKPVQILGQRPTLSSDEESLEDLKQDVKAIALAPNPPPPPPPPPNPNT